MSDKATILTYFVYFLNCLQPYLIRAKNAKNIKGTENSLIENVSIGDISTRATFK